VNKETERELTKLVPVVRIEVSQGSGGTNAILLLRFVRILIRTHFSIFGFFFLLLEYNQRNLNPLKPQGMSLRYGPLWFLMWPNFMRNEPIGEMI
jgi:hypothetical protein